MRCNFIRKINLENTTEQQKHLKIFSIQTFFSCDYSRQNNFITAYTFFPFKNFFKYKINVLVLMINSFSTRGFR